LHEGRRVLDWREWGLGVDQSWKNEHPCKQGTGPQTQLGPKHEKAWEGRGQRWVFQMESWQHDGPLLGNEGAGPRCDTRNSKLLELSNYVIKSFPVLG